MASADPLASMTLQQLRIFARVAETLNFRRAAELLNLSEPSVSNHVKALEHLVGARLLQRGPGRSPVQLTGAGNVLLSTCEEVFHSLDKALHSVGGFSSEAIGSVRFGTNTHFAGSFLPRIHQGFCTAHPGVSVHVEVAHTHRILEALKSRRLDLAVIWGPVDDPDITTESLAGCDLVLVGCAGHQLARRPAARVSVLEHQPFVVPDRSAKIRQALDQAARDAGVLLHVVLEVSYLSAITKAVGEGMGVTLLPAPTARPGIDSGDLALLHVDSFPIRLTWTVVQPNGESLPGPASFRDYLLSQRDSIAALSCV